MAYEPGGTGHTAIPDQLWGQLCRLHAGLRSAADIDQHYPPLPPRTGAAARELRRAADAIAILADILATHTPLTS